MLFFFQNLYDLQSYSTLVESSITMEFSTKNSIVIELLEEPSYDGIMTMTPDEERKFLRHCLRAAELPAEEISTCESLPVRTVLGLYPDILLPSIHLAQDVEDAVKELIKPRATHLAQLLAYGRYVSGDLNVFLSTPQFHKENAGATSAVEEYIYDVLGGAPYQLKTGARDGGMLTSRFHAAAYSYIVKEWSTCNSMVNGAGIAFNELLNKALPSRNLIDSLA